MELFINDRKMKWNTYLSNGVSYIDFKGVGVPIKDFFEEAGFKVEWDNDNKIVRVTDENFNKPSNNVQARLNKLGLKSVKELQQIFGLTVDGIVGKNTLTLLDRLDKITNFKLDEFRCNHCGKLKLDIGLLELLEKIRQETGALAINSGYRCPIHNKNVGGATRSQHLKGTAADIRPLNKNMTVNQVYSISDRLNPNGGVGKYNTFTHVDTRGHRSRWG